MSNTRMNDIHKTYYTYYTLIHLVYTVERLDLSVYAHITHVKVRKLGDRYNSSLKP